jgi:hypothetical protein
MSDWAKIITAEDGRQVLATIEPRESDGMWHCVVKAYNLAGTLMRVEYVAQMGQRTEASAVKFLETGINPAFAESYLEQIDSVKIVPNA